MIKCVGCESRGSQSESSDATGSLRRLEVEREPVDAVALTGRRWTVVKDMAEVAVTPCATHLDAHHAVAGVALLSDAIALDRSERLRRNNPTRGSPVSVIASTSS